jgi:hypothetical protein
MAGSGFRFQIIGFAIVEIQLLRVAFECHEFIRDRDRKSSKWIILNLSIYFVDAALPETSPTKQKARFHFWKRALFKYRDTA